MPWTLIILAVTVAAVVLAVKVFQSVIALIKTKSL